MTLLEICLAGLLVCWALGSVLFLFRIPGLHGWLRRCNGGQLFIHWGVFSTSDPSLRAGTFELHVIDGDGVAEAKGSRVIASGYCWSWRAFFWMPRRYYASALQNMGRHFKMLFERTPPPMRAIEHDVRVLKDYATRICPPEAGVSREIRLKRCFPSHAASDENVVVVSSPGHGKRV